MEIVIDDEENQQSIFSYIFMPFTLLFSFLADYGWIVLGAAVVAVYVWKKLQPMVKEWQEAREDAFYKKNPDVALARMEAIQRAREKQQQLLVEASLRAAEEAKEREERKRRENIERLEKYGSASAGHRLGAVDEADLPLSRGASSSSYRPPKKSKCGGGGCGR